MQEPVCTIVCINENLLQTLTIICMLHTSRKNSTQYQSKKFSKYNIYFNRTYIIVVSKAYASQTVIIECLKWQTQQGLIFFKFGGLIKLYYDASSEIHHKVLCIKFSIFSVSEFEFYFLVSNIVRQYQLRYYTYSHYASQNI